MTDENFLITAILKGLMEDKNYAITVTSVFDESYFDDPAMSEIFKYTKEHIMEHNNIPERDIIINSIPKDVRDEAKVLFQECDSTDFSVSRNYDWLIDKTDQYLKDKAIKKAILDGIDIIDSGKNIHEIRDIVESALCKTLKLDIGLNYFEDLAARLKRILNSTDIRVKTYYHTFDELFSGGFPPYTLNMFIAKVHGHKSNIMTNIISRQVLHGVDVALASLEMSTDMYAQRFDANFTNLDINRIYINNKIKKQFIGKIKDVSQIENKGNLYIKEYPTGKATVNDYRIWLRELGMRDRLPKIFFCDYISLMKAEGRNTGDLYKDGKAISEELRALGFEFNLPVVTVAQINRAGTFLDFDSLDMNSIGESFGIPATADTMIVQGCDEDDMTYKNELKWKCVKNRLGGRVGDTGKLYYDSRSLRIYGEDEIDQWFEAAKETGDERNIYERDM
jgi:hypothetical protein